MIFINRSRTFYGGIVFAESQLLGFVGTEECRFLSSFSYYDLKRILFYSK